MKGIWVVCLVAVMSFAQQEVDLDGVRYRCVQRGAGPDWLFVPGGAGVDARYFLPLLDDIDVPGSIWLIDLPGNGDNPGDGNYDVWFSLFPKVFPEIVTAVQKTHRLVRPYLARSMMRGEGGNQRAIVENAKIPLCIVQGEKDEGVNNDYVREVFPKMQVIEGARHAPFWDKPDKFNAILSAFLSK